MEFIDYFNIMFGRRTDMVSPFHKNGCIIPLLGTELWITPITSNTFLKMTNGLDRLLG